MENKYVVYGHYDDSGICFYVGIGNIKRPYTLRYRSVLWQRYVGKHCVTGAPEIKIWAKELTWEKACGMEKQWIALYGRKDKDTGCLVNLTDGGEGAINPSKDAREAIAKSRRGKKRPPYSAEWRRKLGLFRVGKKYPHSEEAKQKISKACKGRTITEECKIKISQTLKGRPAPNKGKTALPQTRTKRGKGYYFRKDTGKWRAVISSFGKKRNLGTFDTEEEAAAAYNNALAELFPA
jgi:hypothetical protein